MTALQFLLRLCVTVVICLPFVFSESPSFVFYYHSASGPCRNVEMTARHLEIGMDKKLVNLFAGEQLRPEFIAINPQHTLPTIIDDGFILWESRAIMQYLVNKYVPDSPIYPKDPKARAIVDRMLYFDIGRLYIAFVDFIRPQVFGGLPKEDRSEKALKTAFEILDKILEKTSYVAGDNLTLPDFSILSTCAFLEEVMDFNFGEFPKVSAWFQKMKEESPDYQEINAKPLKKFKEYWKENGKVPIFTL